MRRSFLLTLSALGLLVCLLGSAGLFAALTDTAYTGDNSVNTAPLDGSADLRLATASVANELTTCGTFDDDLSTGLLSVTDLVPMLAVDTPFCVRNDGIAMVDLTAAAVDLSDVDPSCTGDEADYGDETCGTGGDGSGELAPVLNILWTELDCFTGATSIVASGTLSAHVANAVDLLPLGAGETACYRVQVVYADEAPAAVQIAQSDTATWRFRFDAAAQVNP